MPAFHQVGQQGPLSRSSLQAAPRIVQKDQQGRLHLPQHVLPPGRVHHPFPKSGQILEPQWMLNEIGVRDGVGGTGQQVGYPDLGSDVAGNHGQGEVEGAGNRAEDRAQEGVRGGPHNHLKD